MTQSLTDFLSTTLFEYEHLKITVGSILAIVIIFLVVKGALKVTDLILKRSLSNTIDDKARGHTIYQIIKYITYVIAFFLSIKALGFDITIIIGASAALMVGIGLGLQDVFKDIFSGIVLLIEGVFKVGDVIEVDGIVCRVKKIDLRTSKVENRDGTTVVVPNSNLVNKNLINWSVNHRNTRFFISVGVAYGSDTQKVATILKDVVNNHELITLKRRIFVKFHDFGDSALVFEVYFWTDKQWEIEMIKSDLRFEIDKQFREANISIPFPQRDLHLVSGFDKLK